MHEVEPEPMWPRGGRRASDTAEGVVRTASHWFVTGHGKTPLWSGSLGTVSQLFFLGGGREDTELFKYSTSSPFYPEAFSPAPSPHRSI